MNSIPHDVAKVRKDLSNWLWHFTNVRPDPLQIILQILEDKTVKASKDRFCLQKAVCFTEMPLINAVEQQDVLDQSGYSRFSGYGIGFPKKRLFNQGGLPVIYQPPEMRTWLPDSMRWRHCDFDLNKGLDFSWQREWRVPHDVVFGDLDELIIVVKTIDEMYMHLYEHGQDSERDEIFADPICPTVTHEEIKASEDPYSMSIFQPRSYG